MTRSAGTAITAGATPTRTSVKAKVAEAGATARSQAATNPMPPARTCPFTRATTGWGSSARHESTSGSDTGWSPVGGCSRSCRSAPEQNTVPAPVNTTARTPGSACTARRAAPSSASSRTERALRFRGESRVTVTTGPRRSARTSPSWVAWPSTNPQCRCGRRAGPRSGGTLRR